MDWLGKWESADEILTLSLPKAELVFDLLVYDGPHHQNCTMTTG